MRHPQKEAKMLRAHPDHTLISSEQVEGSNVFNMAGEKVGQIDHLMIDKQSGHVAYAVMSFGGFLGVGHNHYPLPWSALNYDTKLEGYRTSVNEGNLKDAPEFTDDAWGDREWEKRVHDYYGAPYYW
jgi:hypothetical protein